MSEHTQLTSATGYDVSRMRFSQPVIGTIPNSVPPIVYKRINISTQNSDGSIGELVIPTEQVFSFGVGENTNPDSGKINGYVMPLCLWNRDEPTKAEKDWSTTFDNIVEYCKTHLLDNKEEIEQYNLEQADLKKLNPLYWKKEKGRVVEGTGPTLYAKLIVSKKHNKVATMFFDADGNTIDAMSLIGKYSYVKGAIKIESIFIGNKISLQIKLYEAEVKLMDTGMKRLLAKPASIKAVSTTTLSNPLHKLAGGSDDGSIDGSDDDTPQLPPKTMMKKVEGGASAAAPAAAAPVKKVITKVVRKTT